MLALARERTVDMPHDRAVWTRRPMGRLTSTNPAVLKAIAQAEQVAATPATVLLLGETGVGKDVFAQAIHDLSSRRHREMVRVNCAAIPSTLMESELFGRERGAYTDAISRQIGRIEAAHQSTLFLDEIGELSAKDQVKLLRVLQDKVIHRLGGTQAIKVDVRIIAATNCNLEQAVEDRAFREISSTASTSSRLSSRRFASASRTFQDSCGSSSRSFRRRSRRNRAGAGRIDARVAALLVAGQHSSAAYVIERAVILATGPQLVVQVPQRVPRQPLMPAAPQTLKHFEFEHIRATLEGTCWRVRGQGGAAELLGLKPTTLESRMAKLGLSRPGQRA